MKCETYMLQDRDEIVALAQCFKDEGAKSYIEVGCKFGGSLWIVANMLPKGSVIVAVDLPQADKSFKDSKPHLIECVEALRKRDYHVSLILGDSTDQEVIDDVYKLGPFDATFIDANHTVEYVKKDFANYGPISKVIAFHDINFYRPGGLPPHKKPIEVRQVWDQIKIGHRSMEIIRGKPDKLGCRDNGIGVLWTK